MQTQYVAFPAANQVSCDSETLDTSELGNNEAVITSEASIISAGTELARLAGLEGMEFPARPGYGMIGTISERGPDLDDFADGERVFFAGKHSSAQRFTHRQGHQWGHLFRLPQDIDPVAAAVGCMAQIAITAPNITELKQGDTVAVFGLGLVGILAAQLYRLRGARVLGVDPVASRCELARSVGITEVCQAAPGDQVAAVRAWGGDGVNVCCDATGVAPAVANAIHSTALLGQTVLLGSPRAAWESNTTDVLKAIHMNGLTVRGAHMWRFPLIEERGVDHSVERNFRVVFDLIHRGELRVRELISHVIKPKEAAATYAGLRDQPEQYRGAVIDWR
ncbi:MAG: zinc-binding alcohol dehydrogenase [Planctomycetota bacterium]|jgi:threonine dehydrogenase-like Zn-dependent dehydrogenase|nr:zinc-binding alcohol dehydrogenase [Planctomycetota bacterium]